MSQRELGKQKAQRIDVLHYRQRTWLTWMRWLAIGCGLCLSCVYVGWVIWLDQPATPPPVARSLQLSTGPLSQVHASFESDCQKCHADNFGIGLSPDSWQVDKHARLALQADKCGECHVQAAGDPSQWHFRDKLAHPELDQDCALCHQDHQGRRFELTHVADAACNQCHQNLSAACKSGVTSALNNSITDFSAASHGPIFRSLTKDTGRIKFNHAEHMQPGQVAPERKGAFQSSWLPKARYQSVSRDGLNVVQLDCKDCHEPLKMSDATRPNSTAREEGRYFAPVSFERHCADCHQLNFAGQTSENLPLPHYASSAEFKRLLSLNFRVGRLKGSVAMATDKTSNAQVEFDQTIVDDAVRSVFQRCQQCHLSEDINEQVEGSALQLALVGKNQSLIPERWLQYGYYDHAAHSMISRCDYCHPGTRSRDELTSQKIEQIRKENPRSSTNAVDQYLVKINSVSSCLPCHRDSVLPDDESLNTAEKRKLVLGEARQPIRASNACTLCHRYHWSRPLTQVAP